MESVIRNVRDIDTTARRALERLLGETLCDDARLVIEIIDSVEPYAAAETPPAHSPKPSPGTPAAARGAPTLPDWCDVYNGLSDEEISELEDTVLQRADLSRPSQ